MPIPTGSVLGGHSLEFCWEPVKSAVAQISQRRYKEPLRVACWFDGVFVPTNVDVDSGDLPPLNIGGSLSLNSFSKINL